MWGRPVPLAILLALITPMPALLLDFLLAIDIMLSVIVLMVSVYITRPVEFSVSFFPHSEQGASESTLTAEDHRN